jgi:hypothetical protein
MPPDPIPITASTPTELAEHIERVVAPLDQLRSLQRFATGLVAANAIDEIARSLMSDGLDAAGAAGGSLMIVEGTRLQLISERELGADIAEAWSEFNIQPTLDPISDALTDQQPAFYAGRDTFLAAYPHLVETIESTPHHSWVVLPLLHERQPIGAVGFTYEDSVNFGDAEKLALLTIGDLAAQAVIRVVSAIEERRAFASLHAALLDLDIPQLPGVTTASTHRAATKAAHAGGDWFNATQLSDGKQLFVIGDVAHHGTAAVGEMGRVRAVVLAYALEGHTTSRIAELTTLTMSKLSSTFATACIVVYDPATRRLTWTNAGHPYPLLIPRSGEPMFLAETHGPPLGVDSDVTYARTSVTFEPGDTLLLYSDGLIERRDTGIDADFERLRSTIPLDAHRPRALVDQLVDRLHPAAVHDDDIAVLAITAD